MNRVSLLLAGALCLIPLAHVAVAQSPSVQGLWELRSQEPHVIPGRMRFHADGTGVESLGPIESRFTWTQQGSRIVTRQTEYARLTSTFEIRGNELVSADPGPKAVYVRIR